MNLTIHTDGMTIGPFPEHQVREMLKSRQLSLTDLGSNESMTDWKPLSGPLQDAARRINP